MTDSLLDRARRLGTPLIDGNRVTFVWDGDEEVRLVGDWTHWESGPLRLRKRVDGWRALTAEFPADAYLEYAFLHSESGVRLPDPFNRRRLAFGDGNSISFFSMPDRPQNQLIRRRADVPQGRKTKHRIGTAELVAGHLRTVHLYQPPGRGTVPLLVVLDGADYLVRGKLAQVVDNLIAQDRIRPIAMALVNHGGMARKAEYGCSDGTLALLDQIVLPLAERELNLVPGPRGILGASMGGLMGLCSAVRRPDLFDKVLSQSGAFILDGFEMAAFDIVRHLPVPPIEVWMDVGRFESFLEASRQMHTLLKDRGYAVAYREYPGGHNYAAWRDDLWRGLETLYPPL